MGLASARNMNLLQASLFYAGIVMLGAILAGLVVKRRVRLWYTFALLVAASLASTVLIALWPGRFYRWSFWQTKETVHSLIRFAMAVELGLRTFRAFPGALAMARRATLVVIALTWVAVSAVPTGVEPTADARVLAFVAGLQPRVVNGTVWLFTAIAALILWYHIPVHPFHKAVLLGYVPYLLVFTILVNALGQLGWQRLPFLSLASQIAYVALEAFWAHAAWRRYPEAVVQQPAARQIAQTA
jgi:hypothetical protein